jgi:hypothetical protein
VFFTFQQISMCVKFETNNAQKRVRPQGFQGAGALQATAEPAFGSAVCSRRLSRVADRRPLPERTRVTLALPP